MKKVVTVLGDIAPEDMGITSSHDHILIDMSGQFVMPLETTYIALSERPLSMENLGNARTFPWGLRDNLVINNVESAIKELNLYRQKGGGTIVDATSIGLGRDLAALYAVAKATNVNIVAGSGYYYADTHPEDMPEKTVETIRDEIVHDITEGSGYPNVRCGFIGEIGLSSVLQPNEEKVLKGAAQAQMKTGASMQVHVFPWAAPGEKGLLGKTALSILEKYGANIEKVCINHMAVARNIDLDEICALLDRGAYVSFDNFGHEFMIPRDRRQYIPGPFSTDWDRCETIAELISRGYIDQLLIGNDICHKAFIIGLWREWVCAFY